MVDFGCEASRPARRVEEFGFRAFAASDGSSASLGAEGLQHASEREMILDRSGPVSGRGDPGRGLWFFRTKPRSCRRLRTSRGQPVDG